MNGTLGVVLERPSGPDRAEGRYLAGEIGQMLVLDFAHFGVNVHKDAIVTYAVPDPTKTGERIALVKPEIERLQKELAPCTKVLACGPMAMAGVWPLGNVPAKYHKKRGHGILSTWGDPRKFLVPTYSLQQVWSAPDYARDLYFDIQKIVTQDAPQPEPQVETVVVQSIPEARYWLDQLCQAGIIGCDIETDGVDCLQHRISSIGFAAMYRDDGRKGKAIIIPRHLLYPPSEYLRGLLLYYLGPRSPWKGVTVWQNAVFDLQFLYEYLGDWPFYPRMADTLLMNYACDERPIGKFGIHSLKDISRIRFDLDYGFDWKTFLPMAEEMRPYDDLYRYNGLDCFITARTYEILRAEMNEEPGLDQLVDGLLIPATKALARVARKGLLIDQDYLRSYRTRLDGLVAERDAELRRYAAEQGMPDLVPSSSQQVAQFLFGTLGLKMPRVKLKDKKPGAWSTAKIVLDKVRKDCTEDQRTWLDNLLAYRLYNKTRSTYVDALLEKVSVDGRIHPNLFIAGTVTGRLSAASPNMQNQPVHTGKDMRRAFITPDGYSYIHADFKNLELRVMAYFSQEPVLVEAFRNDADLHRATASKVFGKSYETVTDHERFLAKAINFGIAYGRSAEAIAEGREMDEYEARGGTRWTLDVARQFHEDYMASMPLLKKWITDHTAHSFATKVTITPYGRRRRFPLVTPYDRKEVERQIVNTVVQSTASDITLEALIKLVDALPDAAWVVLTIHDALLVECRDDLIPSVTQMMRNIMEQPSLPDKGVPWKVDIAVAKNWADIKD